MGCLKKLKSPNLSCPLCRHSFPSVEALPANFVVLKWMEESLTGSRSAPKAPTCENCEEERPAELWCENCAPGTYYCKQCDAQVHSGRATRAHSRLTLKEKSKQGTSTKCTKHQRAHEVYCLDCSTVVCTLCLLDSHSQHKAQSVSKCAEERRGQLEGCIGTLGDLGTWRKLEEEVRLKKEKDQLELKVMEEKVEMLRGRIKEYDGEIHKIAKQEETAKTSEMVLRSAVKEMSDFELMEEKNVFEMKRKIQEVLKDIYPHKSAGTETGTPQHNTLQQQHLVTGQKILPEKTEKLVFGRNLGVASSKHQQPNSPASHVLQTKRTSSKHWNSGHDGDASITCKLVAPCIVTKVKISIRNAFQIRILGDEKDILVPLCDGFHLSSYGRPEKRVKEFPVSSQTEYGSIQIDCIGGSYVSLDWVEVYGK
uniref:B box-type domain-containing protein n=1 Tax=Arcella intermedia TaxID=1963864 RepID=A0A6B2L430_9EUKA